MAKDGQSHNYKNRKFIVLEVNHEEGNQESKERPPTEGKAKARYGAADIHQVCRWLDYENLAAVKKPQKPGRGALK